jgi:asparagine synthase (glutamine-hydrolysing)
MLIGQGADEFAGGYSNGLNKPRNSWDEYVSKSVIPGWRSARLYELGVPAHLGPAVSADALGGTPQAPFKAEMRTRLRTLQMFNLWHEDRTSSGQGVEARVPYLDHRLVELLASIPGRLHAELFWDKQIIRRAARRWLPEAFVSRRKLPFVYGADRSSTIAMMFRWVAALFPAFAEKYLQGPHRCFEDAPLREVLRLAEAHQDKRDAAVRFLIECMAVSIFERMCRVGPGDFSHAYRPPSPLANCPPALTPWKVATSGIQ